MEIRKKVKAVIALAVIGECTLEEATNEVLEIKGVDEILTLRQFEEKYKKPKASSLQKTFQKLGPGKIFYQDSPGSTIRINASAYLRGASN